MIELTPQMKKLIAKDVGLSFSEIKQSSASEIDKHIENKIGKELKINFNNNAVAPRGSVYIALRRFIGLDKKGNITYSYEKM